MSAEIIDFPKSPEYATIDDVIDILTAVKERGTEGVALVMVLKLGKRTHPIYFQADAADMAFAALQIQAEAMFAGELLLLVPDDGGV